MKFDLDRLYTANIIERIQLLAAFPTCLRGTNKLVVPRKKTTNFGLKSATFIGAKVWNSLSDELRSMTILKKFLNAVRELNL